MNPARRDTGRRSVPEPIRAEFRPSRLTHRPGSAMRRVMRPIHVIGGGLAGSEAAWQAAEAGASVVLHEMRPQTATAAHRTEPAGRTRLLELLPLRRRLDQRGRRAPSRDACARLDHHEMRRRAPGAGGRRARGRPRRVLGRRRGGGARAPAGHARARRNRRPSVCGLGQCRHRHRPADLAGARLRDRPLTGEAALAFFDAIAPIVHRDSIDMDVAWLQSRYDKRGRRRRAPPISTAR